MLRMKVLWLFTRSQLACDVLRPSTTVQSLLERQRVLQIHFYQRDILYLAQEQLKCVSWVLLQKKREEQDAFKNQGACLDFTLSAEVKD